MRTRHRTLLTAALLLVATSFGCRSGEGPFASGRRAQRPVRVQVENHNFLDVTVYASGSGAKVRLGDVSGKQSGSFTVDPRRISMAGGLQFQVDPLGSAQTFLSERVFPDRASTVILTVADVLEASYILLR